MQKLVMSNGLLGGVGATHSSRKDQSLIYLSRPGDQARRSFNSLRERSLLFLCSDSGAFVKPYLYPSETGREGITPAQLVSATFRLSKAMPPSWPDLHPTFAD